MLRNLNDLEKSIFKRSMCILFNTASGSLVIDDELVSSRAKDVECKAFSDRKTGKDGVVADCLADSMIGMLLGMSFENAFTYIYISQQHLTRSCELCILQG